MEINPPTEERNGVKIYRGDLCLSTTAAFCGAVSFPAAELFIRFFSPHNEAAGKLFTSSPSP